MTLLVLRIRETLHIFLEVGGVQKNDQVQESGARPTVLLEADVTARLCCA